MIVYVFFVCVIPPTDVYFFWQDTKRKRAYIHIQWTCAQRAVSRRWAITHTKWERPIFIGLIGFFFSLLLGEGGCDADWHIYMCLFIFIRINKYIWTDVWAEDLVSLFGMKREQQGVQCYSLSYSGCRVLVVMGGVVGVLIYQSPTSSLVLRHRYYYYCYYYSCIHDETAVGHVTLMLHITRRTYRIIIIWIRPSAYNTFFCLLWKPIDLFYEYNPLEKRGAHRCDYI